MVARRKRESGQGMVEYALILLLIALVLILIVTLLGHQTSNLYSNVSNSFPPAN
jgi:pilus assembly protein Flp/PilA